MIVYSCYFVAVVDSSGSDGCGGSAFVCVSICVCFSSFTFTGMRIFSICVFLCVVNILRLEFSF